MQNHKTDRFMMSAIRKDHAASTAFFVGPTRQCLILFLYTALLLLPGCGGGSSNSAQNNQNNTTPNGVSGNWQFTMGPPADNSFLGGLQGGFLLQNNTSITGGAVYAIELPATQAGGSPSICNSGSAPITGTANGQNITLTAVAGPQTFTLTGGVSTNGLT